MASYTHAGDTLIHLDIQASNRNEIIKCVYDSIEYMPGWKVSGNLYYAFEDCHESRFFSVNLSKKYICWQRNNNTMSDTMDEDEVVINDLADISYLLEYAFVNADVLSEPVAPKSKLQFDMSNVFAELMEIAKKNNVSLFTSHADKIDWNSQHYPYPYTVGGKSMVYEATYKMHMLKNKGDLAAETAEAEMYTIETTNSEKELMGLYKKLEGLHGPYATKLKHTIQDKLFLLKTAHQKAKNEKWDAEQAAKKKKNHELDSWSAFQKAKVGGYQSSIDAQVKLYEQMGEIDPYKDAVIKVNPYLANEFKQKYYYAKPKKFYSEYQNMWKTNDDDKVFNDL